MDRKWTAHCKLWERAFGDTDTYIQYYFANKAPLSRCFDNWEEQQLCAMAFFTPYDAVLYGEKIVLPYIVGVATKVEFRHQGRMKALLTEGFEEEAAKGSPLVFLSPANTAIYEPLGFFPVYCRDTLQLTGDGDERCEVRRWSELKLAEQEQISHMAEHLLEREKFDLRLVHSVPYYKEVCAELEALDGTLLTFWKQNKPLAVANWIYEEEKNKITEWIGLPEYRENVLQTLQSYLKTEIYIEDNYFLEDMRLPNTKRIKQPFPYLMVRMLDASVPLPKRCYINDIT